MEKEPSQNDPKVIILDANTEQQDPNAGYQETIRLLQAGTFPLVFRITSLVFSLAIGCLSLMLIVINAFALAAVLITFGKISRVKEIQTKCWAMLRRSMVFTLGLFISVFNPVFGMGIITLYYMLLGEKLNEGVTARMFTATSFTSRQD